MVELLSLLYLYCHRHTTAGKSSSLISDGASEEI